MRNNVDVETIPDVLALTNRYDDKARTSLLPRGRVEVRCSRAVSRPPIAEDWEDERRRIES